MKLHEIMTRPLRSFLTTLPVVQLALQPELRAGDLWHRASPETQGFSAAKLGVLREGLATRNTKALLVIRNDTIVCEWYASGQDANTRFGTASLAKALVGGVSFAVAMSDGRIGLDNPAARFIPQWRDDPRKSRITPRQLGSHTSGMEDAEADNKPHDELTGWKGDFWKHLAVPGDPFTISRDRVPLVYEPGTEMRYSNPGIALLTYCVTASLRDAPQKDIRSLLRDRVLRPIGVSDAEWSAGYSKTSIVDGLPLVGSWGGATFTSRAAARVGRLMLRGGDWDGKRILSAEAVRLTTLDAGTPGPCGIGWWSNNEGDCAKLPRDAFFGSGAGHQILLVIPSLNVIVVRFGGVLAQTDHHPKAYHEPYRLYLFEPLMQAITDRSPEPAPHPQPSALAAPYPPSPVIARLEWAPTNTIIRQAPGSDNWPLTWAEDDALYGAYGDGNGFAPFTPQKLSMGFARITSGPLNAAGTNIRSKSETSGDGPRGKKASGLLCVDGILYLLARNVGNSQLAWSTDHAQTWTWVDWKFTTSFGCPTFLHFGKNYRGARDGFVYVYSPDQDNAYEPADRMVLARVPRDQLRQQSAYEYFVRLDTQGQPVWSKDIAHRGAVFTHPGHCCRSGITYNAALKRYLWVQILSQSRHPQGPRFQDGLGVYDAPEPWGPWTTVYFTQDWDVGPGETGSFPAKWISADGQSLTYVFSGEDSFSIRQAKLILKTGNSSELSTETRAESDWRPLALITDGTIAQDWVHVGWGGFVVDGDALSTQCDPKGLGLLVYKKERFGSCQIRVVFRSKDAKSNSGLFVRIADGILDQVGRPGAAFDRDVNGKISKPSMQSMMASAHREEGPWFAVNRGYEVQIMDANDKFHRTGAIYSLAASEANSNQPNGHWKTMIITLSGNHIFVDLEGQRVTSFDPESPNVPGERQWFEPKREPKRPENGYIGLQNHDPGDAVWFKEISVRPLPEPSRKK